MLDGLSAIRTPLPCATLTVNFMNQPITTAYVRSTKRLNSLYVST
jgi:hypothetical protein